jgi:hypothetical protein
MPFELPASQINILDESRNSIIRLNQRMETDVVEFMQDYEDFWGVSGADSTDLVDGVPVTTYRSNGSKYTLEQMQQKIDLMPQSTAFSVLVLAGMKRDMIASAEQFLGESYLPDRYRSPAFTMVEITGSNQPIVLTGLAAAWTPPE